MLWKAAVKGYGEFGWNFIKKPERVCRQCSQPITKMDDVGEIRYVYPGTRQDLLCKGCQRARSEATIQSSRS